MNAAMDPALLVAHVDLLDDRRNRVAAITHHRAHGWQWACEQCPARSPHQVGSDEIATAIVFATEHLFVAHR